MMYKPERALTHHLNEVLRISIRSVEMMYKPERALTQVRNYDFITIVNRVEMMYKPERALTPPLTMNPKIRINT